MNTNNFQRSCITCKNAIKHKSLGYEYARCGRKGRKHNFAEHEWEFTCKGKYWIGNSPEVIEADAVANMPWWKKLFVEI